MPAREVLLLQRAEAAEPPQGGGLHRCLRRARPWVKVQPDQQRLQLAAQQRVDAARRGPAPVACHPREGFLHRRARGGGKLQPARQVLQVLHRLEPAEHAAPGRTWIQQFRAEQQHPTRAVREVAEVMHLPRLQHDQRAGCRGQRGEIHEMT